MKSVASCALLFALLAAIFVFCCQRWLIVESGPVHADAMVMLGGANDRADRAAALFHAGEAPRVLVSGDGDYALNVRSLKQGGVPAERISVESKSGTTRDNARFSIPILRRMGARRVILVTSWYHSRRALACFRHEAPEIQFYSRPSYVGFQGEGRISSKSTGFVVSEWFKIAGYALRFGIFAF